MAKRSSDDFDNDRTDELPVLIESVVPGEEPPSFAADERTEDTNEQTVLYRAGAPAEIEGVHAVRTERAAEVAGLKKQLAALTERDRQRERVLAERDTLTADLHRTLAAAHEAAQAAGAAERRLATQLAVRDARVAEMTGAIEKLQDEAHAQQAEIASLRGAADATQRQAAALQSKLNATLSPTAGKARSEFDELLEVNASLRDYIEGRRAWWDEMLASQGSLQAKVASLEESLATATKRAAEAEALADRESSRATLLRADLVESARRVTALERERRDEHEKAAAQLPHFVAVAPATTTEGVANAPPGPSDTAADDAKSDDAEDRAQGASMVDPAINAVLAADALAQLEGEVEYKRQQVAAQLVELHDRDQKLLAAAEELDRLRREAATLRNELEESRSAVARLERAVIDKDRTLDARDARITALQDELKQRIGVIERLHALDLSLSKLDTGRSAATETAADSTDPALLCLTGDAPKRFALTRKTTSVGRGPQCDLQILTHFVSREHARITVNGGTVVIEDLGSRNGVFVNSVRVDRQALQQGDLVTIGETQFRFMESMAH